MNLKEIREKAVVFSGRSSDLNQKACFAGIAIIWVLRIQSGSDIRIAKILVWALLLFAASLLIQVLYYSVSAGKWDNKYHSIKSSLTHEEQKCKEEDINREPFKSEIIPWIAFYLSLALTVIGYICIIKYLISLNIL